MEDENKVKDIMNIIIRIIAIIITILIIIFVYNQVQTKLNTNKLYKYLENNNYEKNKNNYYTKKITQNNQTITEIAAAKEYLFAKKTITSTENKYINMFLEYDKNNTIKITYKMEGYNENNQIASIYQTGTLKNNKFTCKIVSNQNLPSTCDTMQIEAKKYEKQIKNILKTNKIKLKYVKPLAKKTNKF